MALAYTKEFLVDAYMSRYFEILSPEKEVLLRTNAETLYDKVGKDKFREYASLDAEAIRTYRKDFHV